MILDVSFVGSFAEFVSVVGLCSRVVGDLNLVDRDSMQWRPEPGRLQSGLYYLNWSIVRSFSGAISLSESGFVFQY